MKTVLIISGVVIVLLLIMNACFSQNKKKNHEAMQTILNDSAFLVDVRTPEEFAEGHIEGSVNIPLDVIEQNLDKFEGKKHIVVFCKSGMRSASAKSILESHKYSNVVNGGGWKDVKKLLNP